MSEVRWWIMRSRQFAFIAIAALCAFSFVSAQGNKAGGTGSIPATPIKPSSSAQPPAGPGPEVFADKAFPAFKMTDIVGKVWTSEELKGKVLLIDFWATWCGPCKLASPIMQALHEKYASQGLVVIGANCSERDKAGQLTNTPDAARGYATEHEYSYLFTYGNDDLKKSVNIRGIPTMFVVDRKGVTRFVQVGYSKTLQDILEKPIVAALSAR